MDRERLHADNGQQRIEIAGLKHALKQEQETRKALESSLLRQAAQAGKNAPTLDPALADFEQSMLAETTRSNTRAALSVVRRFRASLPAQRITSVDITTDISRFLDAETNKGKNPILSH